MENKYLDHVLVMLKQVEFKISDSFSSLSETQLNWKSNDKTWSIAECLDHLIVTTELYFKVFDDIKNNETKSSFWMKVPFYKDLIGKILLKAVDPETAKKTKTSKDFYPTKSNYSKEILDKFDKNQGQLIVYINELDGYDHSKIVVPSPINNKIVYKLTDAFNILWKHQIRHYNQALDLLNSDGFPKS